MRVCAILAVMLVLTMNAGAGTFGESAHIRFRLRDESDILVPVTVNGRGPYRFLLDTGSARSAVTARLGEQLELVPAGQTTVITPSGRELRSLVHTVIQVGVAADRLLAMVVPQADLGAQIDGVLGADLLGPRRFTIDYTSRRLLFGTGNAGGGVSVPLSYGPDGFLATLPVSRQAVPLRLVPDSGTPVFVLFARPGRPLLPIVHRTATPVRGLGTLTVGWEVALEELLVGCLQFRDQRAILIAGSTADQRFHDGLLPLHLFTQVTFDAPRELLTLSGRPRSRATVFHRCEN